MTSMVGAVVGAKTQGGPIAYSGVAEFEKLIGRPLAIDSHFVGWEFSGLAIDKLDAEAGRIPLIAWKLQDSGLTAKNVTSGKLDAHIRDVGGQLAQIPGRVLLRFMDEMNIHPELGTPADVIAAWKHVRHIIRPLAPRVEWVQCLTARAVTAGTAQAYYVGPRYCDWLAVDGYNLYPNAGGWVMPDRLFDAFYAWAAPLGKPLMIAEVGTTNDGTDSSRKAAWITALGAWIMAHPLVTAWSYTHSWSAEGNFRVDETPEALAAYTTLVHDPYMTGTASSSQKERGMTTDRPVTLYSEAGALHIRVDAPGERAVSAPVDAATLIRDIADAAGLRVTIEGETV